jgi:predicted transposase/invertase (TIGR01784 family)
MDMQHTGEVYINPLTDFGFKRIFGTAMNKDLLISFLNALFDGEEVIKDVSYRNGENFGANEVERKAIFDVYCQTADGSRIIVEMQNVYQEFYKDRSIYYSTFPIAEQAQKGKWDYKLNKVYTVGILNFSFPEDKMSNKDITSEVKLMNVKTKEVFYDKLTYYYIELVNFKKSLNELDTLFDKWLYVLRNMSNLLNRPAELQERIFTRLFDAAQIAKLSTEELREYETSVNAYRDIENAVETAKKVGESIGMKKGFEKGRATGREEGRTEGRAEGRAEGERNANLTVAKNLKAMGMSINEIAKATGLSVEEIAEL